MDFLEKIYAHAKKAKKRILLPEGEEIRVLKAVAQILKREICLPIILGNPDKISKISKAQGVDLKGAEIVDYKECRNLDKYIELFCEIRKHKNLKKTEAKKLITQNPVYYSALAVRTGDFDGFVAGAAITTRDVAKAAIYCIGPREGISTISSSSVVVLPDKNLGSNGVFIFADAGIVPDPTAEQLCDIVISTVDSARMLLDDEPKVAMLSYSTKGSGGSGESVKKVQTATELVVRRMPDLLIDGEIQVDCAVIPEIAKRKDPKTRIKGRANVFIFPNLDSGNIAYKIIERLAKARAIGPLLQGLRKPVSDLSRGCDSQDIVDGVAITALRAEVGGRREMFSTRFKYSSSKVEKHI